MTAESSGQLRQSSTKPFRKVDALGLTLPHYDHAVAQFTQTRLDARITRLVCCELVEPEGAIPRRRRRAAASWMTMPEASVNEHGPSLRAIRDVWRARQVAIMDAEAVT